MYRADRLLDPASSDHQLPRLALSEKFWTTLTAQHPGVRAGGRVLDVSLSHLGPLGLDRYEVLAQVLLPNGWVDYQLWLLTREELEAVRMALGDEREAAGIAAFIAREGRD
ncbi:MAG TPA: hypothetical protein VFE23_14660 [Usitatibacter sp.]|jgi:hypothetical protein|nr:hypothetical protein [Usitatibacter sp.]